MRLGVGANAAGLLIYAIVPVLLGMIARSRFPDLATPDLALPTILVRGLPAAIGTLGLAAVWLRPLPPSDERHGRVRHTARSWLLTVYFVLLFVLRTSGSSRKTGSSVIVTTVRIAVRRASQ